MTILPENALCPQLIAQAKLGAGSIALSLATASLAAALLAAPGVALGQAYGDYPPTSSTEAADSPKAKPSTKPPTKATTTAPKKPSKKKPGVKEIASRKKACRTYANKLIGYYGKVYRVAGCKRYLVDHSEIAGQIRRYGAVRGVDSDIVKLIPPAKMQQQQRLSCKEAEGRVFLTLSGQIFQVAGCRRYTFPDWETFLEYRKKGRVKKRSFVEVEDHLAQTLPEARVYPSVLDSDSAAFLRDNETYDIIPAKRACRGLEGRYVTYYSQVYKIEKCKRRPLVIEPTKLGRFNLKELTSSQWLSIPEGKPLKK